MKIEATYCQMDLKKSGNVDLMGQTIELMTKHLCLWVYVTLMISLIKIWHYF